MSEGEDTEVTGGIEELPPLPADLTDSPFPDLPKPGRRSETSTAVPFDPIGSQTFSSLQAVKPTSPTEAITRGQVLAARRAQTYIPRYPTLEGMYANHPAILASGRLRIERLEPHYFDDPFGQKVKVRGIIDFDGPCISSAEFFSKFGGYKWRVTGMVPVANSANPGGPPQLMDQAACEFEIPAAPVLSSLPLAESQPMSSNPYAFMGFQGPPVANMYGQQRGFMPPMYPQYPQYPPPSADASAPMYSFMDKVLSRQPAVGQPLHPAMFESLTKLGETSVHNVRELSAQQTQLLAEQLRQVQDQLQEERRNAAMRPPESAQVFEAVAKLMGAQKGVADPEYVRQIQNDHERSISNLTEAHNRELARIREDNQRVIAQLKEDYERTLERERRSQTEWTAMENLRATNMERAWQDRERINNEQHQRTIDSMQRDFERAMQFAKADHDARVRELQASLDRETKMHQTLFASQHSATESAHAAEMRSLQAQNARLDVENRELKEKLEQFNRERNKPLLEQVKDIQQTNAAIAEITGAGGDEGADDKDKESPWYESQLAQTVVGAVAPLGAALIPKLIDKIPSGAAGGAKANPPSVRVNSPRVAAPVAQRRPRLPPAPVRRMVFSDNPVSVESLPIREYDPADVSRQGAPPMPYHSPDERRRPAPLTPQVQLQPEPMPEPQPTPEPVATPEAEQSPHPTVAMTGWEPFEWTGLPDQHLEAVLTLVLQAMQKKLTPDGFITEISTFINPAMLKQAVSQMPVERLHQAIKQSPRTNQCELASGAGKRYIIELWKRIDQIEPGETPPEQAAAVEPAVETPKPRKKKTHEPAKES